MEDEGKEWRRRAAAVEEHAKARKRAEEAAAAVAKERGAAAAALQKEMTLDVPTHPTHSGLKPQLVALVEEMYRDGLCVLESGITREQVKGAKRCKIQGKLAETQQLPESEVLTFGTSKNRCTIVPEADRNYDVIASCLELDFL